MKLFLGILALALVCFGYHQTHRAITYPPGVLISDEPEQIDLPADVAPIKYGSFHLKPLARFSIEARLLHRKIYRYDREAALAPVDLAVGWGPMSDQAVLDRLDISQSMRFFWYEYRLPPPIPPEQIVSHGANLHIIPATPEIEAECKTLREGELIYLQGDLVEATGPGIGTWRSSLTRTDSGKGACELVLVDDVRLLDNGDAAAGSPAPTDKAGQAGNVAATR